MPEVARQERGSQLCHMTDGQRAPHRGEPHPAVSTGSSTVDLNADMGEGFGRYQLDDTELLDVVTSASVACGFHAGDPLVMRQTVDAAMRRGVVIGAHPGYPDLVGFGRRELAASPAEIEAFIIYQIGALQGICSAAGTRLRYVKAHGALYNRAVRDSAAANAIARAMHSIDPALALLGLAGSELMRAADRAGIRGVSEAFVDRAYRADGTLLPRTEPNAVLADVRSVAERALRMVQTGTVRSVDGTVLDIRAESLCTHGDGPHALAIVRAVRERLERGGIRVAAFAT